MTTQRNAPRPQCVYICGVEWDIKWMDGLTDDDGDDVSGLTRKPKGYIMIELDQSLGLQKSTLCHELLHACSEMSGWRVVDFEQLMSSRSGGADGKGGIDIEELFVNNLEPALMSVLRDMRNANLLKWLMGGDG